MHTRRRICRVRSTETGRLGPNGMDRTRGGWWISKDFNRLCNNRNRVKRNESEQIFNVYLFLIL